MSPKLRSPKPNVKREWVNCEGLFEWAFNNLIVGGAEDMSVLHDYFIQNFSARRVSKRYNISLWLVRKRMNQFKESALQVIEVEYSKDIRHQVGFAIKRKKQSQRMGYTNTPIILKEDQR